MYGAREQRDRIARGFSLTVPCEVLNSTVQREGIYVATRRQEEAQNNRTLALLKGLIRFHRDRDERVQRFAAQQLVNGAVCRCFVAWRGFLEIAAQEKSLPRILLL